MKNPHFWEGLEAYSLLMELSRQSDSGVIGLILWRAANHILPGGLSGRSVVEAYFPE